jgi:hypothetical protein
MLEERTDTQNDPHLSVTEKNEIINSAIAETWDVIVSSGLAEKYVTKVTFNTTPGQAEYPFATIAPAGDLYRIHQLYVNEGGYMRPVTRIASAEVHTFRAPGGSAPMVLHYIKQAPKFGPVDDALTFDGINGWEEHTLMTAAMAVKMKKDDSYAQFRARKLELEARIKTMGNIDFSEPPRVVRKRRPFRDPFAPYMAAVNAYVLRSDCIELYYGGNLWR